MTIQALLAEAHATLGLPRMIAEAITIVLGLPAIVLCLALLGEMVS